MENPFENWTFEILREIKKEIKTEHLPTASFYQAYFRNRPTSQLKIEEIFAAYEQELTAGNQELADWVVNRWVFKHVDLYQYFAERLSDQMLTVEEGRRILEGAAAKFGMIPTYLFALLNGAVFPQPVLDELKEQALECTKS